MTDLQTDLHLCGGAVVKEFSLTRGQCIVKHRHDHDHISYLASGVVELDIDGVQTRHVGPKAIVVKAGVHHGIKALTGAVWLCIHASHEDGEPRAAEPDMPAAQATLTRMGDVVPVSHRQAVTEPTE